MTQCAALTLTKLTGTVDLSTMTYQFYHYDGLGSVVGIADESGTILNGTTPRFMRFEVYGKPWGGSGQSKSGYVGGLGHLQSYGSSEDDECGLIYMRARYQDPELGRFISEDPAGDGANWYVYCYSNPINLVDTDGKAAMDVCSMAAYIGMVMGFCGSLGFALGQGDFTARALLNSVGSGAVGGIAMGLFAQALKSVYKSPGGGNLIPKRIGTGKALGIAAGSSFLVGLGVGVAMLVGERAGEVLFQLLLIDLGL